MVKGRAGKLRFAIDVTGSERNTPEIHAVIGLERALQDLDISGDRSETAKKALSYPNFPDLNSYLLAGAISLYRYFLSDQKFPNSVEFNKDKRVKDVAEKIISFLNRYGNRKRLTNDENIIPAVKWELYTYMRMVHEHGK